MYSKVQLRAALVVTLLSASAAMLVGLRAGDINYGAASIAISGDCTGTGSTAIALACTKTSGTSFGSFATQNYATPPAIGGTTPAAGYFSPLTVTSAFTAANLVTNADLAQGGANSIKANATGSTANETDFAMPSCSAAGDALQWTSGTGFNCPTDIVTSGANANITSMSGITGQIDISNGTWTSSATAMRLGADAGASTRTNNTSKIGMIVSYPYANAALNIEGILFQNTSTQNIIQVGGGTGTSGLYGATEIDMNTAPTVSTTASSTLYGLRVNSSQHVLLSSSNSPTAASNGTAASCTDKCYDDIGRFTIGASPNASLVVTFASNPTAWPQKPVCLAMDETAGVNMPVSVIATTAVTFTKTTTLTAADQVSYHCFGAR